MSVVANPFILSEIQDGYIPVIAYHNILETGTVTVTGEESDHPKENLYDGFTHKYWKPTSSGTNYITVDTGSAAAVDYFGIYAHNLFSVGGSIQLQSSPDNIVWTNESDAYAPSGTEPFVVSTGRDSFRYWRLKVVSTGVPQIGVAMIGERLELPRSMRPGFAVPNYGYDKEQVSTFNINGSLLGMSTRDTTIEFTISTIALGVSWIRDTWKPFIRTCQTKPFFFAWAANQFPSEVMFCREKGKPAIPTFEDEIYMQVTLNVEGVDQ